MQLIQEAFANQVPVAALAAKAGQTTPAGITGTEHLRALRAETEETFSKAVMEFSQSPRTLAESIKGRATEELSDVMGGKSTIGQGLQGAANVFEQWLDQKREEMLKKYGPSGQGLFGSDNPASAKPQSGRGEMLEVAPLTISGSIDITGAGEGAVQAAMFLPLLQQAIEQQVGRTRSMSPSRSRQLGTVGI